MNFASKSYQLRFEKLPQCGIETQVALLRSVLQSAVRVPVPDGEEVNPTPDVL